MTTSDHNGSDERRGYPEADVHDESGMSVQTKQTNTTIWRRESCVTKNVPEIWVDEYRAHYLWLQY